MSTHFHSQAFRLYKALFRPILYPLVIDYDFHTRRLKLEPKPARYFFFYITFSLDFLSVLTSFYNVLGYFIFEKTRGGMNVGIAYLLVIPGLGLFIPVVVVPIFMRDPKSLQNINRIMAYKRQLFQGNLEYSHSATTFSIK